MNGDCTGLLVDLNALDLAVLEGVASGWSVDFLTGLCRGVLRSGHVSGLALLNGDLFVGGLVEVLVLGVGGNNVDRGGHGFGRAVRVGHENFVDVLGGGGVGRFNGEGAGFGVDLHTSDVAGLEGERGAFRHVALFAGLLVGEGRSGNVSGLAFGDGHLCVHRLTRVFRFGSRGDLVGDPLCFLGCGVELGSFCGEGLGGSSSLVGGGLCLVGFGLCLVGGVLELLGVCCGGLCGGSSLVGGGLGLVSGSLCLIGFVL